MSLSVEQSQPFEAQAVTGDSGLVGTIAVRIDDNDGATVLGPTTANIAEHGATGIYTWNVPAAPGTAGQYAIIWSPDGTFAAASAFAEDLLVLAAGATPAEPPLVPAEQESGPTAGPCTGWVSVEEVAMCCSAEVGSNVDLFEMAATSASQLLYELSGRQFVGLCERLVRPCEPSACGMQVLSRGHIVDEWSGWWAGEFWEPAICDCAAVSRVRLPNYPVREIVEVKIDGVVIAESEYRLDRWQFLTRMADVEGNRQLWPSCQRLDLDDTEEGTFSVSYLHGVNVPQPGKDAAAQLACEIYKSCPGNEGVGTCALPKNATRVTKQGITIELGALRFDRRKGWDTGMKLVDAFLSAYNPQGKRRRPAIWSPDERAPEPIAVGGT